MYKNRNNCVCLKLIFLQILICLIVSPVIFNAEIVSANTENIAPLEQIELTKNNNFYESVLTSEERQWLQDHKTIRLGVDHAWAPFEYFDQNKKYSGVASGYINIIQNLLGIELNPLYIESWTEVVNKAKVRKVDVLPAVAITPERLEYLNFTDAYISFPTVIATTKRAPYIGNLNDLAGLKVGVVDSYVTHENLSRDYPALTLTTSKTLDAALIALSKSEIDAFVDNLAAITYGITKLQIENIKVAAPTEYSFDLHMGVRKDWPELVPILNKALNQIPTGQRSAILNEWVSIYVDLGLKLKTIVLWTAPILFVLLIILSIYAKWNRRLKSEIVVRLNTEIELKKLTTAVEQSPVSIIITDTSGVIEYVNPKYYELSGYHSEDLIGKHTKMFKTGHSTDEEYEVLWKSIKRGEIWSGEFHNKKKDGTMYWEQTSICPIKNERDEIINFVAVKEDITERKENEALIIKQATTDSLTGLPNRTLFLDRINQEISHSKRQKSIFGVLFIDLDNFKKINDTMGHAIGDQYLIKISARLKECIRSSDTLARLGGDEFVILLREIENPSVAETTARKVLRSLNKSIPINGSELFASCSIGISLYPVDGEDSDKIIQHADMAMYRAKELGRNNFQFYSEDINKRTAKHSKLENELRKAIDNNEFSVYYQPIFSLDNNTVEKAEALLRWNHPEHGILTPDKFISITEETGLIVQIGEQVLKQACNDFNDFKKYSKTIKDIAVNCSLRQFQNADFSDVVEKTIMEANIQSSQISLEITENLFINAEDSFAVSTMEYLRNKGIKASLDDFGTGYSSLGYLRRFPVDILKIDKSFLHDASVNPNAKQLVDTIIKMGHSLNLTVVAEGIEDVETAELLKSLDCDYAQGYYYAKPLSKNDFIQLLNHESKSVA
jgi:diguanylate cyclase (GGDEF)-like protein/PAS domain S-box-containing protein